MNEINPIKELKSDFSHSEIRVTDNDREFMDRLKTAIKKVNESNQIADKSAEQVIKGDLGIHEGMLRIHEAEISLKLFLEVRRKVLDAYKEIIHMPV